MQPLSSAPQSASLPHLVAQEATSNVAHMPLRHVVLLQLTPPPFAHSSHGASKPGQSASTLHRSMPVPGSLPPAPGVAPVPVLAPMPVLAPVPLLAPLPVLAPMLVAPFASAPLPAEPLVLLPPMLMSPSSPLPSVDVPPQAVSAPTLTNTTQRKTSNDLIGNPSFQEVIPSREAWRSRKRQFSSSRRARLACGLLGK